jgi:glucokinase
VQDGRVADADRPVLALDLGGTKLAGGLVDAAGTLLVERAVPTPARPDPHAVWVAVARLVSGLLAEPAAAAGVAGVGVGSAGPVDPRAGTVAPINVPGWAGRPFPLVRRLTEAVPGVDVRLAGDGPCMAVAEHWRGAGLGADSMLGVVVSTGVGGGLVLGGRAYTGATGNAGHVGHLVVEPAGRPCACGGRGCVETVASGPSLVRWAREQGWQGGDAKALLSGGSAVAAAALERAGRALAAAFASVAAVCDLDVVVVGGGVAAVGEPLFEAVRVGLSDYAGLPFVRRLEVRPAALGPAAGLVGAAALVWAPERYHAAAITENPTATWHARHSAD